VAGQTLSSARQKLKFSQRKPLSFFFRFGKKKGAQQLGRRAGKRNFLSSKIYNLGLINVVFTCCYKESLYKISLNKAKLWEHIMPFKRIQRG
jgi:hypothetical protein